MKKILVATASITMTSTAALAHPGDHAFTVVNSLIHLLTEPDHLAMMAIAAAVLIGAVYAYKRRSV